MEQGTNFCTQENGAAVTHATSAAVGCAPSNVLLPNDRVTHTQCLWLSEQGLPQSFTLDLTNLRERPKTVRCFGVKCWHAYSSNPAVIDVYIGSQDRGFELLTSIALKQKAGCQFFAIPPVKLQGTFLKVLVKETFGGDKTYINQVFLFEDPPFVEADKSDLREASPESSTDLKRRLASQLKELDEGMRLMKEYAPMKEYASVKEYAPMKENLPISYTTYEEDCGHSHELERLRRQVRELTDKVRQLETQLSERSPEVLIRDTSHQTIPRTDRAGRQERLETRTANSTMVYSPRTDFRAEFDRHIREWETQVLTPQLKEVLPERKTPVPNILGKLQLKLDERARKLELLEQERSRRLKVSSARRSES